MRQRMLWRPLVIAVATVAAGALAATAAQAGPVGTAAKTVVKAATVKAAASYAKPKCGSAVQLMCSEVSDYAHTFYKYVGHDEPSVLYYSNVPGSVGAAAKTVVKAATVKAAAATRATGARR